MKTAAYIRGYESQRERAALSYLKLARDAFIRGKDKTGFYLLSIAANILEGKP